MSGGFGFSREAVRVKVKKCEGNQQPEWRKFSVDPQITSFEVLQSILVKAFDLKGDFSICYRILDVPDREVYLPLLSDWDLDAAFLKAHNISLSTGTEPCLCLRIDLKSFEECSDEWEVRQNNLPLVVPQFRTSSINQESKSSPRLHGIFNQMGKTLNMVQRAFNFGEDSSGGALQPPRPPLADSEFRRYLDAVGQILQPKELRSAIYFGGIDPSLRRVVWKHILNVYPDGMTGKERMDYIKRKASEYENLRDTWKKAIAQGSMDGELAYTTGMVRKDVLRTDRHHPFYAGSDDNQNIASLFNILTTYALNHPKVSYCQGMSDIASPLLVTMNDEAHAYICFCAVMRRLSTNFMLDGIAMTQKFNHLAEGLMHYDPEFYNYLKMHQADDLLFCYRWLLLEMKREFAFDDSLRMLEVLWSSLPADPPHKELKLYDTLFQPIAISTPPLIVVSPLVKTIRENPYTKVCALRRQSSSISLHNYSGKKAASVKRQIHSLDENFGRSGGTTAILDIKLKHKSLDDATATAAAAATTTPHSLDKSPKLAHQTPQRPRSISPHRHDSQLNNHHRAVTKSKSAGLSASMTNLLRNNGNSKRSSGHFRDLKEKLATTNNHRIGRFSSLEILDIKSNNGGVLMKPNSNHNKMVKNLNEFLNFATGNKNKICDRSCSVSETNERPKITLTKSSFDDTDSSSCFDRTHSSASNNSCDDDDDDDDTFDEYSPDDAHDYFPMTTSVTRELRLELENLDRQVFGGNNKFDSTKQTDSMINGDENAVVRKTIETRDNSKKCKTDDIFVWENPLHQTSPKITSTDDSTQQIDLDFATIVDERSRSKTVTPIKILNQPKLNNNQVEVELEEEKEEEEGDGIVNKTILASPPSSTANKSELNEVGVLTNSCEEVTENKGPTLLPPPNEFGGGNPFLMFLCITVLLQHRDHIIGKGMDYNEMAMHFDKMVRKHNVIKVLNQARQMYARYIRQHTMLIAQQKLDSCSGNC